MNAEEASPLVLAVAYWLHMLATVVWIGGLAALALLVLPAARRSLDAAAYGALLARLQSRLQNLGWFSLAILAVTGMFQMSANPSYGGFLDISNNWALAIFAKHIVILFMIAASAYVTWGILPAMQRLALLRSAGRSQSEQELQRLEQRENLMLNVNLVLSVVVLLLTALARSFS